MRRFVLCSLLCATAFHGCAPMSAEDADRLAACQRNAPIYFEGGKLEQAMIQIERGLEIDPDDYKLNGLKGAVLVRASADNPKLVDEAAELLERVYSWRSPMRHEPYVLLYYALARQKLGLRHLGDAIRSEDRATRASGDEKQALIAAAVEQREQADEALRTADELLGYLVERGELLRLAHKHRLQVARQLGDDDAFEAACEAFFAASARDQEYVQREVERTTTPDYEAEQFRYLQQLRDEELGVRTLLADWLFDRARHEEALAQLDVVLKKDPKRSTDYYNRGRILLELERLDAAKADFRRFLATSPLPASSDKMTFAARALQK